MADFLTIATALIEKGFSVIPIEPRGKRPVAGWGVTLRSRDIQKLSDPYIPKDANVAICADENTVILETDDYRKLDEVLLLGCGRGFLGLSTLMACGSSENRPHLFFKRTEKATNVGNLVVPGLFEFRCINQYVVGPGSTHPGGAVYRWLNSVDRVAIPDWLVSELARLATTQKTDSGTAHRIESVGGIIQEGSRHYFLMRELGRLWDGRITEEELIEKAFELNRQCDPPKDTAHVLQCVRDIMHRTPYDPGPAVVIGTAQTEEKKTSHSEEWVSLSAEELVRKDIPPRTPILTENGNVLFYEGSINQILAWRGVGKTCFALGLAGSLASGQQILDFTPSGSRNVLYIDGELPQKQLQERVQSLVPREHRELIQLFGPEFLPAPRGLNLLSNGDFNSLLRLIERNKTAVVFIDSQSTTMSGDSNDSEFQENRQRALMHLRWMGLTVIEMHHVGKTGQQRGISRNDDILDVQMHLKESADWEPEDGLQFQILYKKVRHAAKLETGYTVTLQDGVWSKRPADEVSQAAEMYNAGSTQRDVAKALKCSVGKANHLHRAALRLGLVDPAIDVSIGTTKARAKR